jgi:hypothetical protein
MMMMMIPSHFLPSSFVVRGSGSRGMKSQEKKKRNRKGKRKGIMVVVNLTIPRLKSTTNIRTDRPHQIPRISTTFLFYYYSDVDDVHLSDISLELQRKYHHAQGYTARRRKQILNRSTQNVVGYPPATSDQFFVVGSTLFDTSGYYFKRRQLYPSKLTSVTVLYDVVT